MIVKQENNEFTMKTILIVLFQLMSFSAIISQNSAKDVYSQAKKAEEGGQNISAIKLFSKAIKIDGTNAKAYFGRAKAYYWVWFLRKKNDATLYSHFVSDLNKSIQIDSTDSECNIWMAEETDIKYDAKLKYYNRAIRYCHNNETYFSHRATCLMRLDKFQEAINDLNKALSLSINENDDAQRKVSKENYWKDQALCYAKLHDYERAEEKLQKAIKSNSTEYLYYIYLSTIETLKGEYTLSIKQLNDILYKNKYYVVAYLWLGNIYKKMNDIQLAEKYWTLAQLNGIEVNDTTKDIDKELDYLY
jgi:tetratricopeptide (TPR) repeat protein